MDDVRLGHLSLTRIRSEASSDANGRARDLRRLLGHYHIYENVCDHLAKVSFKTRQSRVDNDPHLAFYHASALPRTIDDVHCSTEEVFSDSDSDTDSDLDDDVEEVWCDDKAVCKNEETLSQNPYLPGIQKEERHNGEDEDDRASVTGSVGIDCDSGEFLQPVFDTYDSDSSDEDEANTKDLMVKELPFLTPKKLVSASSRPLLGRSDTDQLSSPQSKSNPTRIPTHDNRDHHQTSLSSLSPLPSTASSAGSSTGSSSAQGPTAPPSSPLAKPPQIQQRGQRPKPPTRHSTSNLHTIGLTLTIAAPKSMTTPNSSLASQLWLYFLQGGGLLSAAKA